MSWTNIWNSLTALGTISMAGVTCVIIWQGWRQHKEHFRPTCMLMPPSGVDPLFDGRRDLIKHGGFPEGCDFYGIMLVQYVLRNIGSGPALNLRIWFEFPQDRQGIKTDPWELAPLGAGDTRGGKDNPLYIPVHLNDPPIPNWPTNYALPKQPKPLAKLDFENEGNFKIAIGQLQKIWLKYEDSFGRVFCAVHDMNRLQPWVTFTEVPVKGTAGLKLLSPIVEGFRRSRKT